METENIALRSKQKEYLLKADTLIKKYLQTGKKGLLLLSTSGWGLSVPTMADYTEQLLKKFPEGDRALFSDQDEATNLHFTTRYIFPLKKKIGVQSAGEVLYEVTKQDWRERHVIKPTRNPLIHHHRLESFSPLDDYGGSVEFITVNMTYEQIKKLSQDTKVRKSSQ